MAKYRAQVKRFSCLYSAEMFGEMEMSHSSDRMHTYLVAAGRDRQKAARLYAWNTAVSAAFYASLQGLEVASRNAMHIQLASRYGAEWYDNEQAGIDSSGSARIENAKADLRRYKHQPGPPRMVAALSFGFWVSLLGQGGRLDSSGRKANYEMTLWRPALRGAFPYREALTRKQAHGPLDHLRMLRNRIAHHEPIFRRHLMKDHQRILEVTGWISRGTTEWIEGHSRIPELLEIQGDHDVVGF